MELTIANYKQTLPNGSEFRIQVEDSKLRFINYIKGNTCITFYSIDNAKDFISDLNRFLSENKALLDHLDEMDK